MKKYKSTTYDRACNVLILMIDKYLAHESTSMVRISMSVGELSGLLRVSKPTVYDALNLLIRWGHITKHKDGKNSFYSLTDKGIEWVEKHESYVEQRAKLDRVVVELNDKQNKA